MYEQCFVRSAGNSFDSLSPYVCIFQLALFSGVEYGALNPEKDMAGLDEPMSHLTESLRVTH